MKRDKIRHEDIWDKVRVISYGQDEKNDTEIV